MDCMRSRPKSDARSGRPSGRRAAPSGSSGFLRGAKAKDQERAVEEAVSDLKEQLRTRRRQSANGC